MGCWCLEKVYCDGIWDQVGTGRYTEVGGIHYEIGGITHPHWSGMNSIRSIWAANWANWSNGACIVIMHGLVVHGNRL